MKLADVYQAAESWAHLSALKIPPITAYKLLKYAKLVAAEVEAVETQRVRILREVTGIAEGDINLPAGSEGFVKFSAAFQEFINTPSDLEPMKMTMDDLLAAIGKDGNMLSVADLSQLEPFFAEA